MIKQIILIVLLSLAAVFFLNQLTYVLDGLVLLHNYISKSLHLIFSEGHVGRLIQDIISLLILPFLSAIIIALLFWLIKRTKMPHTMAIVWVIWLVLLVTMVAQNTPRSNPSGQMVSETR